MVLNNSIFSNVTETKVAGYRIYFVGIQGVLALPIILGNLLILVSWMKFKELRKTSNILVVNLAVADLMVGLLMIPYEICSYIFSQLANIRLLCMLRYAFFILFLLTSITTLLAISIERYFAIVYPLHYMQHVTGSRIAVTAGIMWVINTAFALAPILGWNKLEIGAVCIVHNVFTRNYRLILYAIMLFSLFLNLAFYARMTVTVLRRISKPTVENPPNEFSESVDVSTRSMRTNVKHTKVMLIVLGLFVVCWLPFISLATAEAVLDRTIPGLIITKTFLLATGIGNSGLNWIIYGWKNKLFRTGFRNVMCCENGTVPASVHSLEMCVVTEVKESADSSRSPSTVKEIFHL